MPDLDTNDRKPTPQERNDTWTNAVTGIGTDADKSTHTTFVRTHNRNADYWEDLYHGSDLAQTICDALPKGALRRGFNISDEDLDAELKGLNLGKVLQDAAIRGRYLGGCAILVELDDGRDLQEAPPFGGANITGFRVMDRIDLMAKAWQARTFPTHWRNNRTSEVIHTDRLVFFYGHTQIPERVMEQNGWWGPSIYETLYETIQQFESTERNIRALIADANQGVYTINDLDEIMKSGDAETLRLRLQLMDQTRSVMRAIVLGNGETFERKPTPLTELANLWVQSMNRLAASALMPVTILFGREPAGMNATGESDIRSWYDRQDSYRQDVLAPAIARIAKLGGVEDITVTWPSLWQATEQEESDIELKRAQAAEIYILNGVLTSEQATKALFSHRAEQYGIDLADLEQEASDPIGAPAVSETPSPEKVATEEAPSAEPATEDVSKTALNGAQVSSLKDIIISAANGEIPRESAIGLIVASFPTIDRAQADAMLGTIGQGFSPRSEETSESEATE